MEELKNVFERVRREKKRAAFVAYTTCGYPTIEDTVPIMLALERGGADVIEVGVPFSDPVADGPTIQASTFKALQKGTNYGTCIQCIREAREKGLKTPVVLMGYYNPFLAVGERNAIKLARDAGANGFIVVDLPPEESQEFDSYCEEFGMSLVPLIAPTSTDARVARLCKRASSFVYCVSITGVTGKGTSTPLELESYISRVRSHTKLPIAVGFGISNRSHFKVVDKVADGVVIGSAIVRAVGSPPEGKTPAESAEAFALSVTTDAKA